MEVAVGERSKAFAAAQRSDEDRQAYIAASRRASSVFSKAKAEAWKTTCLPSCPNLTQNLSTLFFVLSLALLPRLHPHLTSPTVSLQGNRLRSMPLT